jgi:glutamine synthetase
MPKPWAGQSGSGMHIHSSLDRDGANVFGAAPDGTPNEVMGHWTAGLLAHATAMSLVGIPTPNGYRRVRPYTFCPTHVHWGEDNRTVLARLTTNAGKANRVEFRSAGADANPYVAIAAVLAAGVDGLNRRLPLPAMTVGDGYTNPGDCAALPTDLATAIAAYDGSDLAASLGTAFSENFLVLARNELRAAAAAMSGDPDEVTDWERARYLEHT